jgi:hypothetical protein
MTFSVGCVGRFTNSHKKCVLKISGYTLHTLHSDTVSGSREHSRAILRTGEQSGWASASTARGGGLG